jgi:regulator of RNase E activity RraB
MRGIISRESAKCWKELVMEGNFKAALDVIEKFDICGDYKKFASVIVETLAGVKKEEKVKIQVGDIVVCSEAVGEKGLKGEMGVIHALFRGNVWVVEFFKNIGGNRGIDYTKGAKVGHAYNVEELWLTLVHRPSLKSGK